MSEKPGGANPGRDLADRVAAVNRELERARFGGANPVVDVPDDAEPLDVAARILAAERANAFLRMGGRLYNPQQDRAERGLQRALTAVRYSNFLAAQGLLDGAAARAAGPGLQQRIGLWKLLVSLVQRLVRADPDEPLRGDPGRPALDFLQGADRLSEAEREHYRVEVRRLVELHATARSGDDPLPRTLWYLLRARLALALDEPVMALVWCVRAARTNAERVESDEYLRKLLDQGKSFVLLAMGEVSDEEAGEVREQIKGLQAWDLYHALTAQLGSLYSLDAHREIARFSIAPYQEIDE
jgi:hypothetical protein